MIDLGHFRNIAIHADYVTPEKLISDYIFSRTVISPMSFKFLQIIFTFLSESLRQEINFF